MKNTATPQPKRRKSAEDLRDERLRAVKVRVKHNGDGRAETVSAFAAARLLRAGRAEPCGEWSDVQMAAVIEAVDAREQRTFARLVRAGAMTAEGLPLAPPVGRFGRFE